MLLSMKNEYPHQKPPMHLYKYKSLKDSKSKKHVKQLIVDKIFFFPDKPKLNDPFEFHFKYVNNSPDSYLCDLVGDPEEFVKNNPELDDRKIYKNMGIFSLSEDPKNIQMWSYYADSHEGICIEFDTEILSPTPEKVPAVPVTYSPLNDYPEAELLCKKKEIPKKLAYKHKGWEHEKEWRMLFVEINNNKPEYVNGPRPGKVQSISSIILGINAAENKKTIKRVREWIKKVKEKDNHTIRLKQAIAISYKYEIDIVDFPV